MKTQMGSRGIAVFIGNLSTKWGWVVTNLGGLATLHLMKNSSTHCKAGRVPGLVPVGMEKRNCLALTGVPSPDCQACSNLLYQLYFSVEINHKYTTNPIENTWLFFLTEGYCTEGVVIRR